MKSERCSSTFKIIALLAVIVMIAGSCVAYNPAMFVSYDVLNPSAEVRLNPLSATADGNFIVNGAFLQWVAELKAEILKLRKDKNP